jgi:Holliday junction resolvase RusA-like endonuclease
MRRPNDRFKNKNRFNSLKTAMPFARVGVPDIDNLAEFVMDGMNGLVYQDDSQVVKLVVYKLFDSEGGCDGRTSVEVYQFDG